MRLFCLQLHAYFFCRTANASGWFTLVKQTSKQPLYGTRNMLPTNIFLMSTCSFDLYDNLVAEVLCLPTLQVHDELLFEVKSDVLQEACMLIKGCMESAVKLSIPFPVKLKVGPSWGELEPYHLGQ